MFKSKNTRASFVKSLSRDDLREEDSGNAGPAAAKVGSAILARMKDRATRAGKTINQLIADEKVRLRQSVTNMADSEYCLEPEELSQLLDGELSQERREHVDSCEMCQRVCQQAVSLDFAAHSAEQMGKILAGAAASSED